MNILYLPKMSIFVADYKIDNFLIIVTSDFYIELEEQKKYQPIAKFIVAFLTKYSKQENEPSYKLFLQKWYWNTIIYNRYPGS